MKVKILSFLAMSALSINAFANDYATTRTDNASGNVGQNIRIKTAHSFYIKNESSQLKNYLVAETCKVNGKEYKKSWGFSLPSRAEKKFSEDQFLEYPANDRGSWHIESMTCVANSSACSFDHATLTVN
jgi:hypothetical protein